MTTSATIAPWGVWVELVIIVTSESVSTLAETPVRVADEPGGRLMRTSVAANRAPSFSSQLRGGAANSTAKRTLSRSNTCQFGSSICLSGGELIVGLIVQPPPKAW